MINRRWCMYTLIGRHLSKIFLHWWTLVLCYFSGTLPFDLFLTLSVYGTFIMDMYNSQSHGTPLGFLFFNMLVHHQFIHWSELAQKLLLYCSLVKLAPPNDTCPVIFIPVNPLAEVLGVMRDNTSTSTCLSIQRDRIPLHGMLGEALEPTPIRIHAGHTIMCHS